LAAAFIVGCCALAAPAGAATGGFIYWSHNTSPSPPGIGRANLDGTGVNESFITGTSHARAVAADNQHVYWANFKSIGRANLDGTGVDQNFIPNIDNNQGQAVAVDGQHVYWTAAGPGGDGRIGRANLDGSGVDNDFIKLQGSTPQGLTVDSRHVLWSSRAGTLGLAVLSGGNPDENLVSGGISPAGVASNGQYLYWTNSRGIGRYNGFESNLTLIADPFAEFRFVALSPQNVFWANARGIGRAGLDGSNPNYGFIHGIAQPTGVAVSPPPPAECAGRHPTVVGSAADDKLSGTPGADVIVSGGGDDRIDGKGGADLVCAGSGDDRLRGGAGRDQLRGGPGKDALLGGAGRDRLRGGPGRDREEQ
jgi:Ca2+-binding RTX toxin-like protein